MLRDLGSGKGDDPVLPEAIDMEPRPFSSAELRASNLILESDDVEVVRVTSGASV